MSKDLVPKPFLPSSQPLGFAPGTEQGSTLTDPKPKLITLHSETLVLKLGFVFGVFRSSNTLNLGCELHIFKVEGGVRERP